MGPCQRCALEEIPEDVGVRKEVVELDFWGLPGVVLGQEEHHVDAEPTEVAGDRAHGDVPLIDVVFHDPHVNARDPTATQVIEVLEEAILHEDLLAVVQLGHLRGAGTASMRQLAMDACDKTELEPRWQHQRARFDSTDARTPDILVAADAIPFSPRVLPFFAIFTPGARAQDSCGRNSARDPRLEAAEVKPLI